MIDPDWSILFCPLPGRGLQNSFLPKGTRKTLSILSLTNKEIICSANRRFMFFFPASCNWLLQHFVITCGRQLCNNDCYIIICAPSMPRKRLGGFQYIVTPSIVVVKTWPGDKAAIRFSHPSSSSFCSRCFFCGWFCSLTFICLILFSLDTDFFDI